MYRALCRVVFVHMSGVVGRGVDEQTRRELVDAMASLYCSVPWWPCGLMKIGRRGRRERRFLFAIDLLMSLRMIQLTRTIVSVQVCGEGGGICSERFVKNTAIRRPELRCLMSGDFASGALVFGVAPNIHEVCFFQVFEIDVVETVMMKMVHLAS